MFFVQLFLLLCANDPCGKDLSHQASALMISVDAGGGGGGVGGVQHPEGGVAF